METVNLSAKNVGHVTTSKRFLTENLHGVLTVEEKASNLCLLPSSQYSFVITFASDVHPYEGTVTYYHINR